MSNPRLDVFLVEAGYFASREKAKVAIKSGLVYDEVTKQTLTKPSILIDETMKLIVNHDVTQYVSRGGLKLESALQAFNINCQGRCALDIGASTGGFTDCLLQHGAEFVYAIDVGTNQLVPSLLAREDVYSLEQTNFRYIEKSLFSKGMPSLIVTDVSFISLTIIIDKIVELFGNDCFEFIGLIKPQFELEKRKIGKKGVIQDKKLQQYAVDKIKNHVLMANIDWQIVGIIPSPITGMKGNQEFLIYIKKDM